ASPSRTAQFRHSVNDNRRHCQGTEIGTDLSTDISTGVGVLGVASLGAQGGGVECSAAPLGPEAGRWIEVRAAPARWRPPVGLADPCRLRHAELCTYRRTYGCT